MEAVTSALSVVTTAYTVIDFFASVASADEDCKELVRELYTTVRIIDYIRVLAKENAEKLKRLNSLLVPNGELDQFKHTVDDLSSRILQSKGSIKEGYRRVKFVLRHKTVQDLVQGIQRQKMLFMDCAGIENTEMLLQLTADVSVLLSKMQDLTVQASSSENSRQAGVPTEVKHPFLVPFSQDTHSLVVRDAYLTMIESKFETCTRVTLYGLGGSGKSRLAIEFAYRHKNSRPVFWVYAGSEALFRSSYGKIAQTVPAHFRRNFEEMDATESIGHRKDIVSFNLRLTTAWLENDESGDWLLVLDNVDNPAMLQRQGNDAAIIEQLPVRSKGKVLATSRRKDLALSMAGSEHAVIHVDVFAPEEAVDCFKQLLPSDDTADENILSLAKDLGFLPLAIRQAAAYISNQSASIMEYSDSLTSSEDSQLLLLEQEFRDTMRADDVPNSVLRTWLMSFEQLRQQNEEAAKVLCFMAILDRSGVQDFILKEVWKDPLRFRASIGLVLSFSFVGLVGSRRDSYAMHRIIQLSTRAWMRTRGEKQMVESMALSTILRLFADAMTAFRWSDCQILLPHARSLISYTFDDSELAGKKEEVKQLVEAFEEPPLWQLSSQQNLEVYERLSANEDLVDISSTLVAQVCFQEWLQGIRPLLFLTGDFWSGKTVACFFLIRSLKSRLEHDGVSSLVVYFFHSSTITSRTDWVKALLLDIISQLCQQLGRRHVPERIRTLLVTPDDLRSKDDLMETVIDLLNSTEERTFVVLDGFDSREDWSEICRLVAYFQENSPMLSVMLSSQFGPEISSVMSERPTQALRMEELNLDPALDRYISVCLRSSRFSESDRLLLRQRLMNSADTNFFSIDFVLYALINRQAEVFNDPDWMQMNPLVPSLFSLYPQILSSVEYGHRKQASVLLRWIAFAFRPLTERELSSIIGLQCGDWQTKLAWKIFGDVSRLFISSEATSRGAKALRFTLQSFLSTPEAGYFQVHPTSIHEDISEVCLEILLEHGERQCADANQHPFLYYAAEFWPKHLDQARRRDLLEQPLSFRINDLLRRLFDAAAPDAFLCWLRLHDPAKPELGAQPANKLADFEPMEFYTDMFKLQGFQESEPHARTLAVELVRGGRDCTHYSQTSSMMVNQRSSGSIVVTRRSSGEEIHQEDISGSQRVQTAPADDEDKSGEEEPRRDRNSTHRAARHPILCCRPH